MTDNNKIILIGAGAVALIYFGVLNPILQALGIKTTVANRELDTASTDPGSPWSPAMYKRVQNARIMTRDSAAKLASELYNSFGVFNDCEECAIAVFKKLSFRTQVSFLAETFAQIYGQDMLTFIRGGAWPQDRLSDNDVKQLNDYIQKLPLS